MKLKRAREIAERLREELSPFCDRIEIAGSIRRESPTVKDIELVCIPKQKPWAPPSAGLFGEPEKKPLALNTPIDEFCRAVEKYNAIRGNPRGLYTKRAIPLEPPCEDTGAVVIALDLFIAFPENFGTQLAIRTGSAEFSHKILATGWVKNKLESEHGFLFRQGAKEPIPVREEVELFRLINIKFVEPKNRNV